MGRPAGDKNATKMRHSLLFVEKKCDRQFLRNPNSYPNPNPNNRQTTTLKPTTQT